MFVTFRQLGFMAFAALTIVLAWRSVESDEGVRQVADGVACRGVVCDPELRQSRRTLSGWTLEYTTYAALTETVEVDCARSLWLVGDYDCHIAGSNTRGDDRFD